MKLNKKNMLKGIIFDCDGVLIDSRHANISYYNSLLIETGKPKMTKEQEDFVHMASIKQALDHILTPEEISSFSEIAAKVPYKEIVLPLLKLEPDLYECLLWLQKQNLRLAVHTNRGSGMWDVIEKFKLENIFNPVITVDRAEAKPSSDGVFQILHEWKLSSEEVFFIGDSSADYHAATGAKVKFLAYKNAQLPAVKCIESFTELRNFVQQNLS